MLSFLRTTLGWVRVIGFLEGLSFVLLLGIAMPLKYAWGQPEAVQIIGLAHGILFLLYLFAGFRAGIENQWPWKTTILLVVAALVPFGPFVFDAKILRTEGRRANATQT